eukprot:scaffold3884_cov392-Prasinococcus_capsulatus_cf.AAC.18
MIPSALPGNLSASMAQMCWPNRNVPTSCVKPEGMHGSPRPLSDTPALRASGRDNAYPTTEAGGHPSE